MTKGYIRFSNRDVDWVKEEEVFEDDMTQAIDDAWQKFSDSANQIIRAEIVAINRYFSEGNQEKREDEVPLTDEPGIVPANQAEGVFIPQDVFDLIVDYVKRARTIVSFSSPVQPQVAEQYLNRVVIELLALQENENDN